MNPYIAAVAPLSMVLTQLILGTVKVAKRLIPSESIPHWTEYLQEGNRKQD